MIFAGVIMFFLVIAVLSFGRISFRYIEKQMVQEGWSPPEWDKGMGLRITMYAIAIVRTSKPHASLVDDEAIKRHARKLDWYLAVFYIGAFTAFLIVGTIGYFCYDLGE